MWRGVLFWLTDFALLLALWLAFVFSAGWQELLVGTVAAALGACATKAVRAAGHPHFLPRPSWILELRLVPGQIVRDTIALVRKLFRMIFRGDTETGRTVAVPFRAGGSDGRSVARRVFAVTAASISPDSIVIGIDRAHDRALLHLLTGGRVPEILRRLERKA